MTVISKHKLALEKIGVWAALLGAGTIFATMLHEFFQYIGHAPYLAVDEGVINIAHTLSNDLRYGFLSAPVQTGTEFLRTDGILNYGPWYFLLCAALDWIFGYSITLFRTLHPATLIVVAACAFSVFRRYSIASWVIFCLGLALAFRHAEWPMVRADVMVSLFVAFGLWAANRAMTRSCDHMWALSGFAFGSAVVTHQVSFPAPVGLIATWVIWFIAMRTSGEKASIRSAIAIAAGGALSTIPFFASFGFRFDQLFDFYTFYATLNQSTFNYSYLETFERHFITAWSWLRTHLFLLFAIAAGLCLNGISLIWLIANPTPCRARLLALALPPMATWIAYHIGLGAYPNFHEGYYILSHVMALWAAAAGYAVAIEILRKKLPYSSQKMSVSGIAVSIACLIAGIAGLNAPSKWLYASFGWTSIEQYVDHVLAPIEPEASAWGTLIFGNRAGERTNLLMMDDGLILIDDFEPSGRELFLPEYLVIGYQELMGATLRFMAARADARPIQDSSFWKLSTLGQKQPWQEVHLVAGEPYGTTHVYRRGPHEAISEPSYKVNDGFSAIWASRPIKNVVPDVKHVAPSVIQIRASDKEAVLLGNGNRNRADVTKAIEIPPGTYRIVVSRSQGTQTARGGLFIASNHLNPILEAQDSGFGTAATPYLNWETSKTLIVDHQGGLLYLSNLHETHAGAFDIETVDLLIDSYAPVPKGNPSPGATIDLAPYEEWENVSPGTHLAVDTGTGNMKVKSDARDWRHLAESPAVDVTPYTNYALSLPVSDPDKRVRVGVLDMHRRWIVQPTTRNIIRFNPGPTSRVRVVVTNVPLSPGAATQQTPVLKPGKLKPLAQVRQ